MMLSTGIFTVARGGSILHRYDADAATDQSD